MEKWKPLRASHFSTPTGSRRLDQLAAHLLPSGQGLGRVFRGNFIAGLRTAFREGELEFHGHLAPLADPYRFAAWLRVLFRHDWVIYSKRPFGGPEHALRYLGAYTHRVGIANSRLVSFAEGQVSFRWRDSAHGNRKRVMSLPADEFLRRFLLHLLPRGFVRIRNFGFLANRRRAVLLPLCFRLLGTQASPSSPPTPAVDPPRTQNLPTCPLCSGTMRVVERLSRFNCSRAPHHWPGALHEPTTPAPNPRHATACPPRLRPQCISSPEAAPEPTSMQHREPPELGFTHRSTCSFAPGTAEITAPDKLKLIQLP